MEYRTSYFLFSNEHFISCEYIQYYTEHCSVGPTKLIETTIASTTTTARMKISDDEDFRF